MIRIRSSVTIHRPVADVFKWVSDPTLHPHWQLGLVEVKQDTERTLVEVRRLLGRRIEHVIEVVEHEENRLIRHRGGAESHQVDRSYTFEDSCGSTLLTMEVDIKSGGVFEMAAPTLERMLKRQMESSLQHLKDILEAHSDLATMAETLPMHDSPRVDKILPAEPRG